MKKSKSIYMSLILMMLSICILCFGVYAATINIASLGITGGSIFIPANLIDVDIKGYKITTTKDTITEADLPEEATYTGEQPVWSVGNLNFDCAGYGTVEEMPKVKIVIEIVNNGDLDLNVFFTKDSETEALSQDLFMQDGQTIIKATLGSGKLEANGKLTVEIEFEVQNLLEFIEKAEFTFNYYLNIEEE